MLIDFTVSNFRSIKEPQTLSMLATSAKEKPENTFIPNQKEPEISLLKTAAIYGANGSGKSNVIKALKTMVDIIYNSTDFKLGDKIKYYEPFKLDKNYAKQATHFEIEFIAKDKIRYKYSFSFNEVEILSESLFSYPKKQEAKLFIREKGKPIDFGDSLKGAKKNIESLLLPNNLFLSKAANSNHAQLGAVYLFLRNSLLVVDSQFLFDLVSLTSIFIDNNSEYEVSDVVGVSINKMKAFLEYADTGVTGLTVKSINKGDFSEDFDPDDFNVNEINHEVKTLHTLYDREKEIGTVKFDLKDESEGTQRLYGLGGIIIDFIGKRAAIIIDEFNNSFHPLISEFLIRLFYGVENNPKNAQLIFATHDTSILKPELFRRDQVWFTEKDKFGATSLYSLSEFDYDKVRPNVPFDKWYLSGRFGALPLIKEFKLTEDAEAEKGE